MGKFRVVWRATAALFGIGLLGVLSDDCTNKETIYDRFRLKSSKKG